MYLTSVAYCEGRSMIAWYNGATFWEAGMPDAEFWCFTRCRILSLLTFSLFGEEGEIMREIQLTGIWIFMSESQGRESVISFL